MKTKHREQYKEQHYIDILARRARAHVKHITRVENARRLKKQTAITVTPDLRVYTEPSGEYLGTLLTMPDTHTRGAILARLRRANIDIPRGMSIKFN